MSSFVSCGARALALVVARVLASAALLLAFLPSGAHAYNETDCGRGMECQGAQGLGWVHWATTISCSLADKPLPMPTSTYPSWTFASPPVTGYLNSSAATVDAMAWWGCSLQEHNGWYENQEVCDPGGPIPKGPEVLDASWGNGTPARYKQPWAIRYKYKIGPPGGQTCDGIGEFGFDLLKQNGAYCPATTPGNLLQIGSKWICHRPAGCTDPLRCGNPVSMEGEKTQAETDFRGGGVFPLVLERLWSSYAMGGAPGEDAMAVAHPIGNGWRTAWHRRAVRFTTPLVDMTTLVRENGRNIHFQFLSGAWSGPIGSRGRLETVLDGQGAFAGWRYTTPENEVEVYGADGKLVSVASAAGQIQTVAYDLSGRLERVTDPQGRELVFHYNAAGQVGSVTTPDGDVSYEYSELGNLTGVQYPGGASRTYHYEMAAQRYLLTGISDENGNRLSTYAYNASTGLATSTEQAGAVNKYTVAWNAPYATITDPLGTQRTITTTTSSTAKRLLISQVTEPHVSGSGNQSEYRSYDANGNIAQRTDFNGNVTNYEHDLVRNLESKRTEVAPTTGACPSGGTHSASNYEQQACTAGTCWSNSPFPGSQSAAPLGYPNAHYACAVKTGGPRIRRTEWHAAHDLPKRIAEPRRITTFAYHGEGGVSCAPAGASTRLLCSKSVQATTDAFGDAGFTATPTGNPRTWSYAYNAAGQVLTVDGPRTDAPDVTTYVYHAADDPNGNFRAGDLETVTKTVTVSLNHTTQFTHYDAAGRLERMVDPNGLATELSYSPRGWLASRRIVKSGEVDEATLYEYDLAGNLAKATQPDGSWVHFAYDDAHRLRGVDDNLGNAIDYPVLDNMGNRREERVYDPQDVLKRKVRREFDAWNRLSKDVAENDSFTKYSYDGMGNLTVVAPPISLGRANTASAFDSFNRLRQVTDAVAGIVRYEMDGLDQLAKVIDPRNLETRYTVDGLGNQSKLESPDTGTTDFTQFDEAGNVKSATDANGKVVNYTFDALNRVTSASWADRSVTYEYDQGANGLGRLTRITEGADHSDFTYDAAGRLTSDARTIAGLTLTVAYRHDADGRLDRITYPSGRFVDRSFDALGQVSGLSVNAAGRTTMLVSGASYEPFGGLAGFTFGTGSGGYSRSRDLDGRVKRYTLGGATFEISYDDANNITKISNLADLSKDRLYTYDSLDRLRTFTTLPASLNQEFQYDPTGNRLLKIWNAVTTNYTVSPSSNRLDAVGGVLREYDFAGNQKGDGAHVFTYDDRGRLKEVTTAQGTVTYTVNALGQRVRKMVGTVATHYAYDREGHLLGEYDALGKPLREYVWLGDTPVAVLSAQTEQAGVVDDLQGDASPDLFLRHTVSGETGGWLLNPDLSWKADFGWGIVDPTWDLDGVADFSGDGRPDILWRDSVGGGGGVWVMNGTLPASGEPLVLPEDMNWKVAATADFNGDGKTDVVLRNKVTGDTIVWYFAGTTPTGGADALFQLDIAWQIAGAADFDGDGKADFVVFNPATKVAGVLYMNGTQYVGTAPLFGLEDPNWTWSVIHVADYNRDGRPDVAIRRNDGVAVIEFMAGTQWLGDAVLHNLDPVWQQGPVAEAFQKAWSSPSARPVSRPLPAGFAKPRVRKPLASAVPPAARLASLGARPKPTDARKPLRAPPPLPSGKRLAKTGNEDLFAIYHVHTDHLDTPRLVTRPSDRKAVWRWENLDPFGANAAEEDPSGFGAFAFPLRFPGQVFDAETGLHYNYFRDYDPSIGRYVQSDPIGLRGGISTFGYAVANPLGRIDFLGLNPGVAGAGGAMGLGGGAAGGVGSGSGAGSGAIAKGLSRLLCDDSAKRKCMEATAENIKSVLSNDTRFTLQRTVSGPGVQSYVNQLEGGGSLQPISFDGSSNTIVDGNHRYIAYRLCGMSPLLGPGIGPLSAPRYYVREIRVDPVDWRPQ